MWCDGLVCSRDGSLFAASLGFLLDGTRFFGRLLALGWLPPTTRLRSLERHVTGDERELEEDKDRSGQLELRWGVAQGNVLMAWLCDSRMGERSWVFLGMSLLGG